MLQRGLVYGLLAGLRPGATHQVALPCRVGTLSDTFVADAQGVAEVTLHVRAISWPVESISIVAAALQDDNELGCEPTATANFMRIALVGRFPAYEGALEVRGLIAATRSSAALTVTGLVIGLPPNGQGDWHVHSGFNCDGGARRVEDAPAVFLGVQWGYWLGVARSRGLEPWTTTRWRSDGAGVGFIQENFRLERPDEFAPLARATGARVLPSFEGRAVVMHAPDGAYAACGTLDSVGESGSNSGNRYLLVEARPHPDAPTGAREVSLLGRIELLTGGRLAVQGAASGLVPGSRAHWSVRHGFACPAYHDKLGRLVPLDVGTAYSHSLSGNVLADSHGQARVSWHAQEQEQGDGAQSAVNTLRALRGRILLLSDESDAPLACGPLEPSPALVALVSGALVVAVPTECGVAVRAAGAPVDSTLMLTDAGSEAGDVLQLHAGPTGEVAIEMSGQDFEGMRGRVVTVEGLPDSAVLDGPPSEAPPRAAGSGNAACGGLDAGALPLALALISAAAALVLVGVCVLLQLPGLRGRRTPPRNRISQLTQHISLRLSRLSGLSSRSSLELSSLKSPRCLRVPDSMAISPSPHALELPRGNFVRKNAVPRRYLSPLAADMPLQAQLLGAGPEVASVACDTCSLERASSLGQSQNHPTRLNARPRLLALHGASANSEVVRLQLTNLGISDDDFEVFCLDAPLEDEGIGGSGSKGGGTDLPLEALVDGPYFSWYPAAAASRAAVEEALGAVLAYVQRHGPFDGVFGFSQGAAVATALMQDDVLVALRTRGGNDDSLSAEHGEVHVAAEQIAGRTAVAAVSATEAAPAPIRAISLRVGRARPRNIHGSARELLKRTGVSAGNLHELSHNTRTLSIASNSKRHTQRGEAQPLFRFAILAHATPPCTLRIALGLPAGLQLPLQPPSPRPAPPSQATKTGRIIVPSAHIIGISDPLKPRSEAAALLYDRGGGARVVLYHEAAHALPRALQTNVLLRARLLAHIDAVLCGAMKGRSSSVMRGDHSPGRSSPTPSPLMQPPFVGRIGSGGHAAGRSVQPVGFQHRRHAVRSLEDDQGHWHVVSPQVASDSYARKEAAEANLAATWCHWRAVSRLSQIWVSSAQQLVCCHAGTPQDAARTLRELLSSQPTDAPCLGEAGFATTTYGALLEFISCGGGGDLRQLGVRAGEVVAYAAPGGSALAAAAFLAVASQAIAAPLDPSLSEADAARALEQLRPSCLILFEGVRSEGLRAAAEAAVPIAATEGEGGDEVVYGGPCVHEATAPSAGGPAGLFGLKPPRRSSIGLGQLVSVRSSDLIRADAGVEARDGQFSHATVSSENWRQAPRLSRAPDDVCLLLRTSGTTSRPKGVPLVQEALVRNGALLSESLQLTADDVCLNAMPLHHIGGLSVSLLASLAAGGQVTCMRTFAPDAFVRALGPPDGAAEGAAVNSAEATAPPTWYSAVPTMHTALVAHVREAFPSGDGSGPPHTLRFIRSGAAALAPADADALSSTFGGVPVVATYSMSEQMPICSPPVGSDFVAQRTERPGSVGVPVAASLAVVDRASLAPLPPGLPGAIAIGGPTVMRGYADAADDKDAFFLLSAADLPPSLPTPSVEGVCGTGGGSGDSGHLSERFFLTGDVGVLDAEGHLTITGRAKELIKRGGEQVSPYEVEEALLGGAPWVRVAVVFAVPSAVWGEEVGVAVVLGSDASAVQSSGGEALLRAVRNACRTAGLPPHKLPSVARVVAIGDLPTTSTGKYIRTGLAAVLGVIASEPEGPPARLGPPRVSAALAGVRYVLAAQVVFNHVGTQQHGEAEGAGTWAAVGAARFFCMHVPTFYALAAFSLCVPMGPPPRSHAGFVAARLSPLYPMYLLSLLLLLGTLLFQCNPATFDLNFHWEAQPSDALRGDFCEPAAGLRTWGGSLAATIAIYGLGLQSWPIYHYAWFLSYYTWFSSVYYALLAAHPWLYARLAALRGQRGPLLTLILLLAALNLCVVAGFYAGIAMLPANNARPDAPWANWFTLAYYLFPPFWWPTYAMGATAAFLYDAYRPYLSHRARAWGRLCDAISLGLLLQLVTTVVFSSCVQKRGTFCPSGYEGLSNMGIWARLGVREDDGLGVRALAAVLSRLYAPLMVLWLYSMAVGRGVTCRVLSAPLLSRVLAPASYNLYLFHQLVGQLYFLATRHEWWSYWRHRKLFFWFSPRPVPVRWSEYVLVLILTTWLALAMTRVDPWLVARWDAARRVIAARLRRCCGQGSLVGGHGGGGALEASTLDTVLEEIERLTGAPVEPDWSLAECGLASVATPVVVNRLTAALPGVSVALPDVVRAQTVAELAALLDQRRKEMSSTGVT